MSGRSRVHVSAAYIYIKWQGVWGVCVCVMYLFRHSIEILGDHGTLLFAGKIHVIDGGGPRNFSDWLLSGSIQFTRHRSATVKVRGIKKMKSTKLKRKYWDN